jgi:Tfp pilus assembly protein PilV
MLMRIRRSLRVLQREGGFSILENVISVAIFSVGILSISMLFTQTMTYTHFSEKFAIANNLAKAELEKMWNTPYSNVVSGSTVKTVDNVDFTLTWTVQDNQPVNGVKYIVMKVDWKDLSSMKKGRQIEIETILSRF